MPPVGHACFVVWCAAAAGCFSVPGEFRCTDRSQCRIPNLDGAQCEATGYCSYPSDCAATHQRYGNNAGPYAGRCVEPGGGDGGAPLDGDGGGLDGGAGSCPRPYLMVATEDHTSPQSSAVGEVLRFWLDAGGGLHACPMLNGGGHLGALPRAVAFIPPRFVAVAARDATYLVDPDGDQVQWSYPIPTTTGTESPVDVIPLVEPVSGETRVAVGFDSGSSSIVEIQLYRDGVSTPLAWSVNTDLTLSTGLGGITQRWPPTSRFWALIDGLHESIGDDPFTKAKTPYIERFGGSDPIVTIYELDVAGVRRTVWIGSSSNGLYYTNDDGTGTPSVLGPRSCGGGVTCVYKHAVPDPTSPNAWFVLCEDPPPSALNAATIRRVDNFGACTAVFDGTTALDVDKRMVHLGVALP